MQEKEGFVFIDPKYIGVGVDCQACRLLLQFPTGPRFRLLILLHCTVGFNTRRQNFKCGDAHLMNLLSLVQKFLSKKLFSSSDNRPREALVSKKSNLRLPQFLDLLNLFKPPGPSGSSRLLQPHGCPRPPKPHGTSEFLDPQQRVWD